MNTAVTLAQLQCRLRWGAQALMVVCAFAVPLPAAWISASSALFLLVWLAGGDFAARWQRLCAYRVGLLSLALLGWMAVSMLWSPAPWRPALDDWWHYRELLVVPLMLAALEDPRWRRRIFLGLVAGFVVALITSYLRRFGVLADMGGVGLYAGFGGHTGFSTLCAFFAFASLWMWLGELRWRRAWLLLGVLSLVNLFAVNTGRTGQLIFLCLLPLAAYRWRGFTGVAAGLLAGTLLGLGLYTAVPKVRERVDVSINDVREFRHGNTSTNDGVRMEFWQNTASLIADHPLIGGGSGSFRHEYRELAAQQGLTGVHVTPNPHNEYLMVMSQGGIIGLALLLWLWAAQWRRGCRLAPTERYLTHGLLLCMIVGDLFNSFLLDNYEGHFYALLTVALSASWAEPARG